MIRQGVEYRGAEARGRLRQWKKKLAQDYALFDAAFRRLQGGDSQHLAAYMVRSTRAGRQRAFEKISRGFGAGVTLEQASLGRHDRAMAIWSILKPRDAVAVTEAIPDDYPDSERGSLSQDCVTVNYILIGGFAGAVEVSEGLWTLEVPDHALGRAVERSRLLHPGVLIRAARRNLLKLPVTVLENADFTDRTASGVYIKAGPGCFAGYFHVSEDVSLDGRFSASVRVRTWLDESQLFEDQIVLGEAGKPGERLGDGWLKPSPLCHIAREPGGLRVSVWQGHKVR